MLFRSDDDHTLDHVGENCDEWTISDENRNHTAVLGASKCALDAEGPWRASKARRIESEALRLIRKEPSCCSKHHGGSARHGDSITHPCDRVR
mgnify:CR=1 FL=1